MKILIAFLILLFPTWFEVYRDQDGDVHPNYDWKFRGLLCILSGVLVAIIMHKNSDWLAESLVILKYILSSILIFTSVFPYWINFVHLKNGVTTFEGIPKSHRYDFKYLNHYEVIDHVLKHLSNTAWPDKEKWYRDFGWGGRLIVYVLILCVSIYLLWI